MIRVWTITMNRLLLNIDITCPPVTAKTRQFECSLTLQFPRRIPAAEGGSGECGVRWWNLRHWNLLNYSSVIIFTYPIPDRSACQDIQNPIDWYSVARHIGNDIVNQRVGYQRDQERCSLWNRDPRKRSPGAHNRQNRQRQHAK